MHLVGHTVQRFEVIEDFNLVVVACFSENDESEESPCVLVLDTVTTKILQKISFKPLEYPSAIAWHNFGVGVVEGTL